VRVARTSSGGTLAANLVLPRIGGTAASPLVLSPCGRKVTMRPSDLQVIKPGSGGALPKATKDVLVVIDPGHGGPAVGAAGSKGVHEKTRNLQIALKVRDALTGRAGRVVMTRDRDFDASLEFRVALADALRADVAVSVHLNAEPDIEARATPGLETYASVADPYGRRLAGVIYESQRRYLDTLGGPWAADRDAGAKYRLSSRGTDYYGLLRRGHRPWVISESMFLSAPREEALVARPEIRRDLGRAIADGIVAFTQTRTPGSGWVRPLSRPAADGGGRGGTTCQEPTR
jgi:N-acetylmuramoyl-L-alanine amidase